MTEVGVPGSPGRMQVEVVQGDPLEVEGEALVRSVGEGLEGLTPLCRRVGLAAGEGVLARLRGTGDAPVGAALVTPGGDLSVPFLLHLVLRSGEEGISPSGLARALRNGLRQAAGWELSHLILPPLGTGAGNLSAETAARVTLEALREHAEDAPFPSRVTIPVPGAYEEDLFRRERDRAFHGGEG